MRREFRNSLKQLRACRSKEGDLGHFVSVAKQFGVLFLEPVVIRAGCLSDDCNRLRIRVEAQSQINRFSNSASGFDTWQIEMGWCYRDYEIQFLPGVSGLNRLCEIVLVSVRSLHSR